MKAVVFLADGFEECEALIVVDILRRAGVETIMASISDQLLIDSSRHIIIQADALADDLDFSDTDLVILPGGRLGTENLRQSRVVQETVKSFTKDKMIAAVCAAPSILSELGLLNGKKATVHPDYAGKMAGAEVLDESIVVDGNIVTGQGLGATIPFALELVKILVSIEEAGRIRKGICYRD